MISELMSFSCAACGITLTVPRSMAGVSGPCPSCARVITAPSASFIPPALPPQDQNHAPHGSRPQPSSLPPRPPVAGPPDKPSFFSRVGVWLILLLIASPLLLFGGMLVDLKGMFDQQQVDNESSEEMSLIKAIDQIVYTGGPHQQQQAGGAQNLESAILIQGQRLQLEEEIEEEP
jgi:hypothetical protein